MPMRADVLCMLPSALLVIACSKSPAPDHPIDAPGDVPGHVPGMPGMGGHAMSFYHLDADPTALSISAAMSTQSSGSMIVVGVGRGDVTQFAAPTDNKGNTPYRLLDSMHTYDAWPTSGTALYAFPAARGGPDFRITNARVKSTSDRSDEITLAAVEVIEGSQIHSVWNQLRQPPLVSSSITTKGPATLIAFWWGDGFPHTPQRATPNNDFVVIDSNAQELDSFVQCVVAVKNVPGPGTYDVTWTPMPEQGAQMWLVAVE